MTLAQRADLHGPLPGHVRPGGECGTGAPLEVSCLVAGMAAGADSIGDMGLLRYGAMDVLFSGVRAPSTLGSHLRSYSWGNVLQAGEGQPRVTGPAVGPRATARRRRAEPEGLRMSVMVIRVSPSRRDGPPARAHGAGWLRGRPAHG
jgi:hypothetical protein